MWDEPRLLPAGPALFCSLHPQKSQSPALAALKGHIFPVCGQADMSPGTSWASHPDLWSVAGLEVEDWYDQGEVE